MGSYYEATIEDTSTGITKRFDPHAVDDGLKLMEHSYLYNEYVGRIMSRLTQEGQLLTWLCDYPEPDEISPLIWDNVDEMPNDEFKNNTYDVAAGYIILNHTKELKIDTLKYAELWSEKKENRAWILHPLPILCNSETGSMGGGDYHQEESRRATWCGDEIQITYDLKRKEVLEYEDVTEDVLFFED